MLFPRKYNTHGYTIDQTILIVAIIAVLVTMIIVTVGWNLINKSSGTKVASQLKQVEQAIDQFYTTYKTWPHKSYSSPAVAEIWTAVALSGDDAITFTPTMQTKQAADGGKKNFIPGFSKTAGGFISAGGGSVMHLGVGSGSIVGLAGTYYIVYIGTLPLSDVREAKKALEGDSSTMDFDKGRLTATTGAGCGGTWVIQGCPSQITSATPGSTQVFVTYLANQIN